MNNLHYGKQTLVNLVVRDSCPLCTEITNKLESLHVNNKSFQLTVINLDKGETMPNNKGYVITPSIFINNRLWNIGDFEISAFQNKLNSIINTVSKN
ncbi:MAG: glutaredoxin family protein [Candidatus Marinimicrobia bacterium]|nr:glutaredoxin family protein [Candidatus Neomarinimicrobiota bacterium]